MSKNEYLAMLTAHLAGLDEREKENALQYYAEYFADAGVQNEQEVILQLGTPQALAEEIINAVKGGNAERGSAYKLSETYKKTLRGLSYAANSAQSPAKRNAAAVAAAVLTAPFWAVLVLLVLVLGVLLVGIGTGAAACSVYTVIYAFGQMSVAVGNASLCAAAGFFGLCIAVSLLWGGISVFSVLLPKACVLITRLGKTKKTKGAA